MRLRLLQFMLLTFVLGIIAPACGFMWGGKLSIIEICTTEGIERVALADEPDSSEPPKLASDHCPYCFTATHFAFDMPESVQISALEFKAEDQNLPADQIREKFVRIAAPARGPPLRHLS